MPKVREIALRIAEDHTEIRAELKRALLRRGASGDDAEDIVSASLATVLSLPSERIEEIDNLRAYIHAISRNLYVTRSKEASRQILSEQEGLDRGFEDIGFDELEDRETQALVVRAFEHLAPQPREILWHAVVEGEPVKDIASRLGVTVNNVTTQTFRAKAALREAYISEFIAQAPPQCGYDPGLLARIVSGSAPKRAQEKYRIHAAGCVYCPTTIEAARAEATWAPSVLAMVALGGVTTGMLSLRSGAAPTWAATLLAPGVILNAVTSLAGVVLVCSWLLTGGPQELLDPGTSQSTATGSSDISGPLAPQAATKVTVTPQQIGLPMPPAGGTEAWEAVAHNESGSEVHLLADARLTNVSSLSQPASLSLTVRHGDTRATVPLVEGSVKAYVYLGKLSPKTTAKVHGSVHRDAEDTDQTASAQATVSFISVNGVPEGTRIGDEVDGPDISRDALVMTGYFGLLIVVCGAALAATGAFATARNIRRIQARSSLEAAVL